MILWTDYAVGDQNDQYQDLINIGRYYFQNWDEVYPDAKILLSDGERYDHLNYYVFYNRYFQDVFGILGDNPNLLKSIFLTEEKNEANALAVKLSIRGKPWVVTVNH